MNRLGPAYPSNANLTMTKNADGSFNVCLYQFTPGQIGFLAERLRETEGAMIVGDVISRPIKELQAALKEGLENAASD